MTMEKLRRSVLIVTLTAVSTLLLIGMAATGCEGDYPIEPIAYDSAYQIKLYEKPPYAGFEQGYWHQDVFVKLIPNSEPPFYFRIRPRSNTGKKAVQYLADKENSIIRQMSELSNGDILVTATQYFECSSIFISDDYYAEGDEQGKRIHVGNIITIKMKAGRDVKNIEEQYSNALTFDHDTSETDSDPTAIRSIYKCRYNNSYQVLQIASQLYQHEDVEWAEVEMF